MKNIIYILLLLAAQALIAQDSGTKIDKLPAKTIEAYAIKSESKTLEFYNYLEMLSDSKLSPRIKEHITTEVLKLFGNEDINIDNPVDSKHVDISLKIFLELTAKQKNKQTYKVTDFTSSLEQQSPGRQEWVLSYKLTTGSNTLSINQRFYVFTEEKKFGKYVKKVLNTYLGELKIKK